MGYSLPFDYSLLCLLLLLPAISCNQSFSSSSATYYYTSDGLGTPTGACGYGDYGRTVYHGNVAAVSELWNNGTGCGACYQVKCDIPWLCTDNGVNIVVTDYGEGDNTDFILSKRAFTGLARWKLAPKLLALGVVDIEYRRVPCNYLAHNLMLKVLENSRFPDYLAIVIVYQAGEYDVLAVQVQDGRRRWRGMRNAYGAVWDLSTPPTGPINLRFQVAGNGGVSWVEAALPIPNPWEPGMLYDSGLQLK